MRSDKRPPECVSSPQPLKKFRVDESRTCNITEQDTKSTSTPFNRPSMDEQQMFTLNSARVMMEQITYMRNFVRCAVNVSSTYGGTPIYLPPLPVQFSAPLQFNHSTTLYSL
eukprot:TRINITY_DN2555_c0_g1_i2.p1 TRINITY_DN2555_c0_g1~~TRINITY_DN2555_c0_g1_i2.p1  ORF type:complete len:112 (-),score=14.66 TRINITY_DN2555_c0_g1_i2:192-527(-)